ncbi:DUF3549 family protein [Glaciecola sp. MH2013]|uniref:DUF3549 family protein n=1 Tax=Glaciecola sp. MH2013 TaxID=2785524 RepID=UPI0018A0C4E6|nr:DUF3549 family protein [Glaciecola sp. MH2013]MBF7072262.1 DUF3549 family protein [Glaciecola sp. MH2013]
MTAQTINTISEFLLQAGTEYRVYDMGRGIEAVDAQLFMNLENNLLPVPCPRAGYAWFGLVFWNKSLSHEQYIWFVKLPIDERSLIVQAARNQFLETVVEALGRELENTNAKGAQLPENPYVFTPSQQQLADFNALIRKELLLSARLGLSKAIAYIKSPSIQTWEDLALQDIADLAVNIDRKDIEHAIHKNLTSLPVQVLTALCSSFENIEIDTVLSDKLISLFEGARYAEIQHMALRGLKRSKNSQQVTQFLHELIERGHPDTECLVIIAGRHYRLLAQESLLRSYLLKVIEHDSSYELFKGIYSDLVQVPDTRFALLTLMRQNDLPTPLSEAIASLYASVTNLKSAS